MVGDKFWTTGVYLKHHCGRWGAYVRFFDSGFGDDESAEGEVKTRYFIRDIALAIDTVIKDAERLGIVFHDRMLYAHRDGESENFPMPPGWRRLLKEQAERIGWVCPYGEREL